MIGVAELTNEAFDTLVTNFKNHEEFFGVPVYFTLRNGAIQLFPKPLSKLKLEVTVNEQGESKMNISSTSRFKASSTSRFKIIRFAKWFFFNLQCKILYGTGALPWSIVENRINLNNSPEAKALRGK